MCTLGKDATAEATALLIRLMDWSECLHSLVKHSWAALGVAALGGAWLLFMLSYRPHTVLSVYPGLSTATLPCFCKSDNHMLPNTCVKQIAQL